MAGAIIAVAGGSAAGWVRQGRQCEMEKHHFMVCHPDSSTLWFVMVLCLSDRITWAHELPPVLL